MKRIRFFYVVANCDSPAFPAFLHLSLISDEQSSAKGLSAHSIWREPEFILPARLILISVLNFFHFGF
jgi:hypothetical protein